MNKNGVKVIEIFKQSTLSLEHTNEINRSSWDTNIRPPLNLFIAAPNAAIVSISK